MKRIHAVVLTSALFLTTSIPALSSASSRAATGTAPARTVSAGHMAGAGAVHASTTAPGVEQNGRVAAKGERRERIDINSATRKQLMTLPGVGEATSDRIIAGRPWHAKDELLRKNVVTKPEYSKLASRIIARQAPETKEMPASPGSSEPK